MGKAETDNLGIERLFEDDEIAYAVLPLRSLRKLFVFGVTLTYFPIKKATMTVRLHRKIRYYHLNSTRISWAITRNHMDQFDEKILTLLKSNARSPISELARQVNLSRSAVTARIQKLEKDGMILGYHANIKKVDNQPKIKAYLALKFDTSSSTKHCESYAAQFYQIDGIKWSHAISGETDMMLYVETETMESLNNIRNQLHAIPELRHLTTHTVLTEFFNTLRHD